MPPSVARLEVATSTGKKSPCGASQRFRSSSTTPGSTRTVPASASRPEMARRCLLVSITSARPTACPPCEVPAPRGRTGTPSCTAISIAVATSCTVRGTTTPTGSIW